MSAHRASIRACCTSSTSRGWASSTISTSRSHPGLNVLTGETGAGKTMVTTGLTLALGARAAASLVREGARRPGCRPGSMRPDGAPSTELGRGRRGHPGQDRLGRRQGHGPDLRPARHGVRPGRARRAPGRGPRSASGPAPALSAGDPDGVPRPVRRRRAPRGAGRLPGGVRRSPPGRGRARPVARGGSRPRARTRSARLPGARDRRGRPPARARARRSRVEEARLAHVERLIEHTAAADPRSTATMAPPAMPSPRPRKRSTEAAALDPGRGRARCRAPADWRRSWPSSPGTSATIEKRCSPTPSGCRQSASARPS